MKDIVLIAGCGIHTATRTVKKLYPSFDSRKDSLTEKMFNLVINNISKNSLVSDLPNSELDSLKGELDSLNGEYNVFDAIKSLSNNKNGLNRLFGNMENGNISCSPNISQDNTCL